jgi:hypothetical protein
MHSKINRNQWAGRAKLPHPASLLTRFLIRAHVKLLNIKNVANKNQTIYHHTLKLIPYLHDPLKPIPHEKFKKIIKARIEIR